MRTAEIEINGKKHLLCFNLWALMEVTDRYGGLSEMYTALTEGTIRERANTALWVLEVLMKGGKIYADEMSIDNPEPLTAEKMLGICGADFFVNLKANIMDAINNGMSTNVKVENPKNAETTQA